MTDMEAPDTSGIDLNLVCDPASLVFCLQQLRVEAGRPSYRKLNDCAGGKLPRSTLSDLVGGNAQTRSSKPEWDTVRRLVLACGVPEAYIDNWQRAWKRAVAPVPPDRSVWQEEQQRLQAQAEQSATASMEAQPRAADAERENLANKNPPTAESAPVVRNDSLVVPRMSESLMSLVAIAKGHAHAGEHEAAADMYGSIAAQAKLEYGPGDLRTLTVQRWQLAEESKAYEESRCSAESTTDYDILSSKLDERWRELIFEYRRWLPERIRTIIELRLEHACWVDEVFDPGNHYDTSAAQKLLLALHADCKELLSVDDSLTKNVEWRIGTEQKARTNRVNCEICSLRQRLEQISRLSNGDSKKSSST